MIIQSIALNSQNAYDEMYFRGGLPFGNYLKINKGERVSLDTYFNSLDVGVLKKYTSATKISVCLQITGTARLSLCTYDGENEKIVAQKTDTGCAIV